MGEAAFVWIVDTLKKLLGITRKDLINDSLGIYDEALSMVAQAARRKFSDLVWSTIIDNSGSYFTSGMETLVKMVQR